VKIAKGINVRSKGEKFYVFLNHKGLRLAFQYETETQAATVATAFAEAKKTGQLDAMIAAMKPVRLETVPEKECPDACRILQALRERTFAPDGPSEHVGNLLECVPQPPAARTRA
jgi:hypothetical protein